MRQAKTKRDYLNDWRNDFDRSTLFDFAPTWFKFIEWSLIVGALGYIDSKSDNNFVAIVYLMSFGFLYYYVYQNILMSNVWFIFKIDKRWKKIASHVCAVFCGSVVVLIIIQTVTEFTKFAP